jgi:hypothetical protein
MSVTSRKLKAIEFPALHDAQLSAASIADHGAWKQWMRERYHYAAVVRMAIYMGFKIPSRSFYYRMRSCGIKRMKHTA